MKNYKARGVVLHTLKYGDSGLVVYLYTDVAGRQTYLVQGVRSTRSKGNKAALLQPMFLLEYEGITPRHGEMHRMKDVIASPPLASLPFDVRKSTVALFMAEVLYRLIREPEPDPHLFAFIEQAVQALDLMEDGVANFHLWFLVKLSRFLGFYPGNSYAEGDFFDILRGEFVKLPPTHRMVMERDEAISRFDESVLEFIEGGDGEQGRLIDDDPCDGKVSGFKGALPLSGGMIATSRKGQLVIVDLQRAKEVVLYRRYMSMLHSDTSVSQKLLFPEVMVFSNDDAQLLKENYDDFAAFGFEYSLPDGNRMEITGIPADFLLEDVQALIYDMIDGVREENLRPEDMRREHLAATPFPFAITCIF